MTRKYSEKIFNCSCCKYTSLRKYNLIRHQNVKHKIGICDNIENKNLVKNVPPNEKNVPPNEKNVPPNEKNVPPNEKNVPPNENMCKKCNKIYKTKKSLIEHENKCKGIDDLTCSRCMISFSSRQHKARHIKRNTCNPRSIIYARKPNQQNIETQNNIENQNIINNITNNNIINNNNNYIINNYGNERIDYLNYEKMLEIFKKTYDIPSLLTKEIHFNYDFPENNNIIYKNENTSLIKSDNDFIFKNLNNLVKELITEKTTLMQKFAIENKEDICLKMDVYIYEDIIDNLLNLILLKEPSEHYKNQVKNIRDIIKNSNKI